MRTTRGEWTRHTSFFSFLFSKLVSNEPLRETKHRGFLFYGLAWFYRACTRTRTHQFLCIFVVNAREIFRLYCKRKKMFFFLFLSPYPCLRSQSFLSEFFFISPRLIIDTLYRKNSFLGLPQFTVEKRLMFFFFR